MKIHISQTTKELVGPNYKLSDRGEIEVKGKGKMKTYWLEDRDNRTKLPADLKTSSPINALLPNAVALVERKSLSARTDDRRSSLSTSARAKAALSNQPFVSTAEERRVYSPVTFQDVAVRSTETSPVKTKCVGRGIVEQRKL